MWNYIILSVLPSIHHLKDHKQHSLLWGKSFIKSCNWILCVSQFINWTLNDFWWSSLLLGFSFVTLIVRHWTWLSAPWFGYLRLGVWTARRSGCEQVLAWVDRVGDLIRAETPPRLRAAETVSGQRRGCRTGGESWCCHVAIWIGEKSSKGWQWDSLYKRTQLLIWLTPYIFCVPTFSRPSLPRKRPYGSIITIHNYALRAN